MKSAARWLDYRHALKYVGVFGGVHVVSMLATLLRNKCAALWLGPSGMGLASLLNAAVAFLSQSSNLGISVGAVRELSLLYEQDDGEALAQKVLMVRQWSLLAAVLGVALSVAVGYWMLAPAVALLAVVGGETAILKATRRLRAITIVLMVSAVGSLLITLPLYYIYGQAAIVPVILLMPVVTLLATLCYSYRYYPPRWRSMCSRPRGGRPMLRLGIAFTLAGVVGSGAEWLVRLFLETEAGLGAVGLYNAGYLLSITYAGMVFASMDNDYYPRLAATTEDAAASDVVNRQLVVLQVLLAPILVVLIVGLPWIVPLLLSDAFLPIVPMAQLAAVALLLKGATLPVAYLTLARERSRDYLLLESAYWIVFLGLVTAGYRWQGLTGTGVAIFAAHVFDLVLIHTYARCVLGYRVSQRAVYTTGAALTIVSTALWICF